MKVMSGEAVTGLFQRFLCPIPKAAADATSQVQNVFDRINVVQREAVKAIIAPQLTTVADDLRRGVT